MFEVLHVPTIRSRDPCAVPVTVETIQLPSAPAAGGSNSVNHSSSGNAYPRPVSPDNRTGRAYYGEDGHYRDAYYQQEHASFQNHHEPARYENHRPLEGFPEQGRRYLDQERPLENRYSRRSSSRRDEYYQYENDRYYNDNDYDGYNDYHPDDADYERNYHQDRSYDRPRYPPREEDRYRGPPPRDYPPSERSSMQSQRSSLPSGRSVASKHSSSSRRYDDYSDRRSQTTRTTTTSTTRSSSVGRYQDRYQDERFRSPNPPSSRKYNVSPSDSFMPVEQPLPERDDYADDVSEISWTSQAITNGRTNYPPLERSPVERQVVPPPTMQQNAGNRLPSQWEAETMEEPTSTDYLPRERFPVDSQVVPPPSSQSQWEAENMEEPTSTDYLPLERSPMDSQVYPPWQQNVQELSDAPSFPLPMHLPVEPIPDPAPQEPGHDDGTMSIMSPKQASSKKNKKKIAEKVMKILMQQQLQLQQEIARRQTMAAAAQQPQPEAPLPVQILERTPSIRSIQSGQPGLERSSSFHSVSSNRSVGSNRSMGSSRSASSNHSMRSTQSSSSNHSMRSNRSAMTSNSMRSNRSVALDSSTSSMPTMVAALQTQPFGPNPLDSRLWRPPVQGLVSNMKGSPNAKKNPRKAKLLSWDRGDVTLAVDAPKGLYKILKKSKDDIWWSEKCLKTRRRKDRGYLKDSRSAKVYDSDCLHTYNYLKNQIEQMKEKDHNVNLSREQLRGLLTPNIMRGLKIGHRGLELGGGQSDECAKKVQQVLRKYRREDNKFLTRRQALRNRRKKDDGLSKIASDSSQVDRLWARVIALADQALVSK